MRSDATLTVTGTLPEANGGTGAGALTCTNQFLTSNGSVYSCSTDTLAGAQHVNQGTTITVLHGNAAGNPAWGSVVLTTDVSGTLPAANGGTGQSSYTTGDLLYASGASALSKLTAGTANYVLASGGASTAPSWVTPVVAAYNCTAGPSIVSGTATIVDFDTNEIDTDSAVTTGASWHFTVPTGKGGKYRILAGVVWSGNFASTAILSIFKGGTEVKRLARWDTGPTTAATGFNGSAILSLVAGDTIDIRIFQNSGSAKTLELLAKQNYVAIERILGG